MSTAEIVVDVADVEFLGQTSPLTPSPLFDEMPSYKIEGRGTQQPVAAITIPPHLKSSKTRFTLLDIRYEIAKREFVGQDSFIAEIILQDFIRSLAH